MADCPGTMGPSPVGWAARLQTIGLGQPLSCCPGPETDAQEPPVSAPEVTSGAALSLRGGAPERVGGRQWGPHARRPASGTGRGLPGESLAWQVLLLSRGPGAFLGGVPARRQERRGAGGPLLLQGRPKEWIDPCVRLVFTSATLRWAPDLLKSSRMKETCLPPSVPTLEKQKSMWVELSDSGAECQVPKSTPAAFWHCDKPLSPSSPLLPRL